MSSSNRSSRADSRSVSGNGRQRRAFGCITWINMAMLMFLAANFLLALPFRYIGNTDIFRILLPTLALVGLVLIVPGMVLGAILGFRTLRAPARRATRAGAGLGALIGWTGFFTLIWATNALGLGGGDSALHDAIFSGLSGGVAFGAFLPLVILATVIVMFSVYLRDATNLQRQRIAMAGVALALLAGFLVLSTGLDVLGAVGALISTASATIGGWIGGYGYSRAGGEEMLPPNETSRG